MNTTQPAKTAQLPLCRPNKNRRENRCVYRLICCTLAIVLSSCAQGFRKVSAQSVSAKEWIGDARSMGMGDGITISLAEDRMTADSCWTTGAQPSTKNWKMVASGKYRLSMGQRAMAVKGGVLFLQSKWLGLDFRWGQTGERSAKESLFSLLCTRTVYGLPRIQTSYERPRWEETNSEIRYGGGLSLYRVQYAAQNHCLLLTECFLKYRLNEQYDFALFLFNLTGANIKEQTLNPYFHVSMSYRISENLLMLAELEKTPDLPTFIHLGWEKECFDNRLSLRCGGRYPYLQPCGGIGYRLNNYRIDASIIVHRHGGCSYACQLSHLF